MKRIISALDTDTVKDGTGNDSKQLLGLAAWVSGDPTTGIVAGINRANVTAWASQIVNNGDTVTDLLVDLRELFSLCRSGGSKPNIILCNEDFERSLEGQYTAVIQHELPQGK